MFNLANKFKLICAVIFAILSKIDCLKKIINQDYSKQTQQIASIYAAIGLNSRQQNVSKS